MNKLHLNVQFTLVFPKKYPGSSSIQYICSRTTILYRLKFNLISWRHNGTFKPNDILQEICKLENDIKTVSEWSAGNRLVFNNDKLKYLLRKKEGK